MDSIGERIRARRKELNITQRQIQNEIGISSGNMSGIESGKSLPSATALIGLAKILHCSTDWLLTGKTPISENPLPDFFTERYMKLSNEDKQKIDHFMEISLLEPQKPEFKYGLVEIQPPCIAEPKHFHSARVLAILGYVAAGKPIEGISLPLGYQEAPVPADYILIAKGHSMEPVIQDQDYIYVKNQQALQYGDIGIFYIDGDVTCKVYKPDVNYLILQSLNPDFEPLKYDRNVEHDFKIQGKVVLTAEQNDRFQR